MTAIFTIENLSIALLVLLFVVVTFIVVFIKYSKSMNARLVQSIKLINDLYQLSKQHEESIKKLQSDAHPSDKMADHSSVTHIESEVSEIRQQIDSVQQALMRLDDRTEQLQQQDPATKMYAKANKLLTQGASLEDIIEACDLPRAEVEVLIALHRRN